jgi:hypothetical protein
VPNTQSRGGCYSWDLNGVRAFLPAPHEANFRHRCRYELAGEKLQHNEKVGRPPDRRDTSEHQFQSRLDAALPRHRQQTAVSPSGSRQGGSCKLIVWLVFFEDSQLSLPVQDWLV